MNDPRTDAEIFRDVALAAIKETWRWRVTTIVIIVLIVLLEVTGAISDVWKMNELQKINGKIERNFKSYRAKERWDAFLTGTQHRDILQKNCTQHHATPTWENYPQLVPAPTPAHPQK